MGGFTENSVFAVIDTTTGTKPSVTCVTADRDEAESVAGNGNVSVCRIPIPPASEDTSDGCHTFEQLYYQRMKLFSVLVAEHKDIAWKTRCHEDGKSCFGGGWFLVAIDTPAGQYGYHYKEEFWDEFDCKELPAAKPWDGYDESDVDRLMSLL